MGTHATWAEEEFGGAELGDVRRTACLGIHPLERPWIHDRYANEFVLIGGMVCLNHAKELHIPNLPRHRNISMTKHLILTIPASDKGLRREIEQGVEEYADVSQSSSYTDPETVKLVLDIVKTGIEIAGGVAGILTFLRSLQQKQAEAGSTINITIAVPGSPPVAVKDADEALLAHLLLNA